MHRPLAKLLDSQRLQADHMVYVTLDNEFIDYDLWFLSDFLKFLDAKLTEIESEIQLSPDPDSYSLLEKSEYYIGLGFSVIQRYISSTYPQKNITKTKALSFGRRINQQISVIEVIQHVTPWADYTCSNVIAALTQKGNVKLSPLIEYLENWRQEMHQNV